MKVYRGPKTRDLADDTHQLVDTVEVMHVKPWTSYVDIKANITKDPRERESVATIRLSGSDIDNLYLALVRGRQIQSAALDKAKEDIEAFESTLGDIKRLALTARINDKNESFSRIVSAVNAALGDDDR